LSEIHECSKEEDEIMTEEKHNFSRASLDATAGMNGVV
jgi:hypothetical protein